MCSSVKKTSNTRFSLSSFSWHGGRDHCSCGCPKISWIASLVSWTPRSTDSFSRWTQGMGLLPWYASRSWRRPTLFGRNDRKMWSLRSILPRQAYGGRWKVHLPLGQIILHPRRRWVMKQFIWSKLNYWLNKGEKVRIYSCCSRPYDSEGCSRGPHVFYESKVEELHSRHSFSFLAPESSSTSVLDVAALDCEMIYTTGGFRVARVSIVDGSGKEVFDQLVRSDDGVHVMSVLLLFSPF